MDQRLFEAAHTGNIEALHELLVEDPLILERVALTPLPDTPLHVAVLAGKTEFAKEIIRQKPGFASELNTDGFSPIHMASANGNVEIVRELLKIDSSLCNLKDNDERTPLHLATIRGRVDVMGELLLACPESAREVTARGETVLHLAVRYNQFKTFRFLLERLTFHELLNAKDQDGNTILHLAASRKQTQTVELLLSNKFESMVEVNTKNLKNLTALDIIDISLESSCHGSDFVIGQLLQRAQALKTQELITVTTPYNQVERADTDTQRSDPLPAKSLWKEFTEEISRELDNASSETRSALMVIAVLIATVTFQAGINPPDNFVQDNSREDSTNTYSAARSSPFNCYHLFSLCNTTGFFTSLIIISLLTSRFPLKAWLRLAVVSMMTTYACALCFVTPNHLPRLGRSMNAKFLIFAFFLGAVASWNYWWLKKWALIIQKRRYNDSEEQRSSFIKRLRRLVSSNSISHPVLAT